MKLILDNVLVKPFPSDEISEGGIFVPETAREISNKVEVIATGDGKKDRPMEFKSGDTAFRIKGCGVEILVDGVLHYIVKQDWLIAKLN
jgi:chaperonin GroES